MSKKKNTTPKKAASPAASEIEQKREELRLAELHGRLDLAKRLRDELNQLEK